jgi:hypothetical protein
MITTGTTAYSSALGRRYTRAPSTSSSGNVISRQAPSKARYCKWSISAPFSALTAQCVHSEATLMECVVAARLLEAGRANGRCVTWLILGEDLPQLRLLLWTEVTVEQFCVGADEPLPNPVPSAAGGQEEDRRGARSY